MISNYDNFSRTKVMKNASIKLNDNLENFDKRPKVLDIFIINLENLTSAGFSSCLLGWDDGYGNRLNFNSSTVAHLSSQWIGQNLARRIVLNHSV